MNSSRESPFKQVQEFHSKVLGAGTPSTPKLLSMEDTMGRLEFIQEEYHELLCACMDDDIVAVADALADLLYVTYGMAAMMGLPFEEIWEIVHAANMRKVSGVTKRGLAYDAVKPEGWVSPEAAIKELLK